MRLSAEYPRRQLSGTPCFLINLPTKPAGGDKLMADNGYYIWEGGVGPNGTVVALTAICSHQLSYPTKDHTPISYYGTETSEFTGKPGAIVCCEHDRVYDPALGGKMTATKKKATQALAAIRLEYDPASDEIYAKGVYGGARFDDFFKAYKRELIEEYGPGVAKRETGGTTAVILQCIYTHLYPATGSVLTQLHDLVRQSGAREIAAFFGKTKAGGFLLPA